MSRKQYFIVSFFFLLSLASCVSVMMVLGASGQTVIGVVLGFPLLILTITVFLAMLAVQVVETIKDKLPHYTKRNWVSFIEVLAHQIIDVNSGECLLSLARKMNLTYSSSLDSEHNHPRSESGHWAVGEYRNCTLVFHTDDIETLVSCTPHPSKMKNPLIHLDRLDFKQAIVECFTMNKLNYSLKGKIYAKPGGKEVYYKQIGTETNIEYLQFVGDFLVNLAVAYPKVVTLGGEVIKPLTETATRDKNREPVIFQVMKDIADQTTKQLQDQSKTLLCLHCLVRCCGACEVSLPKQKTISYYGCQICGQSREFFYGLVIAILDSTLLVDQVQRDGVLYISWMAHRTLFEFDEVRIVRVMDEDVERFAVQVGNDTDTIRKRRYKQLRCTISSNCKLSENTIRILKKIFGQVEASQVVEW